MLEAIIAFRRQSLDQHNVGFGEFFQRRLQGCILHAGDIAEKAIGEAAPITELICATSLAGGRGDRAAPSAIVAASAGWSGCRLARRAPRGAASLP